MDFLLKEKLETWSTSLFNKLGHLVQGVRIIKGNNALTFISKQDVPYDKKISICKNGV